jgi:hypothetical protein
MRVSSSTSTVFFIERESNEQFGKLCTVQDWCNPTNSRIQLKRCMIVPKIQDESLQC